MDIKKLSDIARRIVVSGKGILAADESAGSIKKRFEKIGVESTEENRRSYREMLFTTPGMEKFISGVILFDETIRQKSSQGIDFPRLLADKGIIPGIKVDKKTFPLALFPGEEITEGLDGLRARLNEYFELGARFSKWRAVINIGEGIPTNECLEANAHALARFAAFSQEAGLVPVVEPEVLMDGDHTIERCRAVTEQTLRIVFAQLKKYRVELEGMLLKPNMVISGKECSFQASTVEIAKETVDCFKVSVPKEVPGIVFLSGGQSPDEATRTLEAINSLGKQPWELSFSYGRALQSEALNTWGGKVGNVKIAQEVFYQRAEKVAKARG